MSKSEVFFSVPICTYPYPSVLRRLPTEDFSSDFPEIPRGKFEPFVEGAAERIGI